MAVAADQTKHFVLTASGHMHEFSQETASQIANGSRRAPEFASQAVRYVQMSVDSSRQGVEVSGAVVTFDPEGRLLKVEPKGDGLMSSFEQDTCVELLLYLPRKVH